MLRQRMLQGKLGGRKVSTAGHPTMMLNENDRPLNPGPSGLLNVNVHIDLCKDTGDERRLGDRSGVWGLGCRVSGSRIELFF